VGSSLRRRRNSTRRRVLTLTRILAETFRKRSAAIAANVTANNALLMRLTRG